MSTFTYLVASAVWQKKSLSRDIKVLCPKHFLQDKIRPQTKMITFESNKTRKTSEAARLPRHQDLQMSSRSNRARQVDKQWYFLIVCKLIFFQVWVYPVHSTDLHQWHVQPCVPGGAEGPRAAQPRHAGPQVRKCVIMKIMYWVNQKNLLVIVCQNCTFDVCCVENWEQ